MRNGSLWRPLRPWRWPGCWPCRCWPRPSASTTWRARPQRWRAQPYQAAPAADARLAALSYDDYRDIRFRPERALWRDSGSLFQLQFFPLGRGFTRPLRLFELVGRRSCARWRCRPRTSASARVAPPAVRAAGAGAAGWRLSYPLNDAERPDEVIVFLGASYFRALGARQLYGLSARGLAVDTVGGQRRGVPGLHHLLVRAAGAAARASCASMRCSTARASAGAYRFVLRPGTDTVLDVQARLFLRAAGGHAGHRAADQHVPDGREPAGGARLPARGARLRRPAGRSRRRRVDLAPADQPGAALRHLLRADVAARLRPDAARPRLHQLRRPGGALPAPPQRLGRAAGRLGRRAASSCCSSARPTRPTTTSSPTGCRPQLPPPGSRSTCRWRVHWTLDGVPAVGAGAGCGRRGAAMATAGTDRRRGGSSCMSTSPARALQALAAGAPVEAVASGNANVRGLRANAYPNPERGGWRVSLDFERIDAAQPVELRAAAAPGRQRAFRNLGLRPCTGVTP